MPRLLRANAMPLCEAPRLRGRRRLIATGLAWCLFMAGAPRAAAAAEEGILLNVGPILVTQDAVAARLAVGPFEGRRLHLVQLTGPTRPEWYAELEATGAEVIQYIPSFAYLVYGDAPALARVQEWARASSAVRWEGAYLDRHKVQPAARAAARARVGLPTEEGSFAIQLVADPQANVETERLVEGRAAGPVRRRWSLARYRNVIVTLPLDAVEEIAARPDVVSIDRYVTPQMHDERQARILSGQLAGSGPAPGDHLAWLAGRGFTQAQFEASGFVVDVADSGIDNGTTTPNHFGLRVGGRLANPGRVQYSRLEGTPNEGGTIQGCDGHGTLNAHILAGSVPDPATLPSPETHADAEAFRYGLGVCPFVKVGSSVLFDPGYTYPSLPDQQARAHADQARISTNSWGASAGGAYTVDAQTVDALVRDARPATSASPAAGNQEMVIVFSAGNDGPYANTIGSPAVAKNVLAVGASEGVQPFGGADGCGVGDAAADSAADMAAFSSRGPTDDGRVKPDLVAPGTHVSGGVFQAAASLEGTGAAAACFDGSGICGGAGSSFFPPGQQFYSASSGTSHAAPAVAGGAALVRQHFINGGLPAPSPAMTKALLVNSARHMNGVGANDSLPSNSQGMGRVDLDALFAQASSPRILRDQVAAEVFTASGQQRVVTGTVADGGEPFRVTLAWTDAPGATSGAAYVNDLDLEVTVGGSTYRGNVFAGGTSTTGGSADPRNNLESVFLPAGLGGPFSVKVLAANVAGDGVPGVGGALDQDYALVVSNAVEVARPVVVAGTASVVADSCSGNGVLDPGEAATVSLCLQNAGTAGAAAVTATLLAEGGVAFPSGPQEYGALVAGGAAVCRTFSFVVGGVVCGEAVTPTLSVQDGDASLGTVSWTLPTGVPAVALAEAFDGVAPPSLPAGWATTSEAGADAWITAAATPDTVPNAAFVNNPSTISLTSLVSPVVSVPATPAPVLLTFRHSYSLETNFDGGVLEMRVGGGGFQDVLAAGGSFLEGGYTSTLSASYGNPLGGRPAWSGATGGYVTTTLRLPASASGQAIQLRWRRGSDSSGGTTGWRVDSVSLRASSTCCVPSLPVLSIADASVLEGDSGTTSTDLTVSLSVASGATVSVAWATADGTATTADGDYVAASGSLTFSPGVTSRPVTVTVNGDATLEAAETFRVILSGPVNATVGDGQGVVTITNDDSPPKPDLVVSVVDVVPALATPGLPLSVTYEVTNQGAGSAGPSALRLWLSRDELLDTGADAPLGGDEPVPSLSPGQSVRATVATAVPPGTPGGPWHGLAQADVANAVAEDSETNNVGSRALRVVLPVDFDGDGRSDILWHHQATRSLQAWLMSGTARAGGAYLTPSRSTGSGWQVRALADFNDDGHVDALWQDERTGDLSVWFLDGTVRTGGSPLAPARAAGPSWELRGAGDFDDDGKPDLLWHDQVTGELAVWRMSGTTRVAESPLAPAALPASRWRVRGLADFDRDGRVDVLWHSRADGELRLWLMDGTARKAEVVVSPPPTDPLRKLVQVSDLDADGWPDLLWRAPRTGELVVWLMNGATRAAEVPLTPAAVADGNWAVVPDPDRIRSATSRAIER